VSSDIIRLRNLFDDHDRRDYRRAAFETVFKFDGSNFTKFRLKRVKHFEGGFYGEEKRGKILTFYWPATKVKPCGRCGKIKKESSLKLGFIQFLRPECKLGGFEYIPDLCSGCWLVIRSYNQMLLDIGECDGLIRKIKDATSKRRSENGKN
jgi:hypothetical protein